MGGGRTGIWAGLIGILGLIGTAVFGYPTRVAPLTSPSGAEYDAKVERPQEAPSCSESEQHVTAAAEALLSRYPATSSKLFLVATVADPNDPPLALEFDRQIDALVGAAQNFDYVLNSSVTPWKRSSERQGKAAEPSDDQHDSQVGAILFRYEHKSKHAPVEHGDDELVVGGSRSASPAQATRPSTEASSAPPLLTILLVPETPTGGADRTALLSAFRLAANHSDSPRIFLLGPTYSGSATSIGAAINSFRSEVQSPTFEVVSGSATSLDLIGKLHQISGVRFHATVLPDQVLQESIVHYLLSVLEVDPKDVALLVERDSSYGQSIIDISHDIEGRRHARYASDLMVMPFPMNISSLRETVEHTEQPSHKNADTLGIGTDSLEFRLETGVPTHLPQGYASASLLSSKQIIESIISEINRDKFKYVGIAASGIADKIFLARQVRKFNPDLTVFFIDSDLLLAHPELDEFFGSLVVSTYPLFTRNQVWSAPYEGYHYRTQFPSGPTEGTYNAALSLLRLSRQNGPIPSDPFEFPLEYGGVLQTHKTRSLHSIWSALTFGSTLPSSLDEEEDSNRITVFRPPVWVTAIGRGYFWPLTVQYPYAAGFADEICGLHPPDDVHGRDAYAGCRHLPADARNFVVGHAIPADHQTHPPLELIPAPYVELLVALLVAMFVALHGLSAYLAHSAFDSSTPLHHIRKFMKEWWCFKMYRPVEGAFRRSVLYGAISLVILLVASSFLIRWFVGYPLLIASPFKFNGVFYAACAGAHALAISAVLLGMSRLCMQSLRPVSYLLLLVALFALSLAILVGPYHGTNASIAPGEHWASVATYQAQVLFAYRVTALRSGVSPATPFIVLVTLAYLWCVANLNRWRLNKELADSSHFLRGAGDDHLELQMLLKTRKQFELLTSMLLRWFWKLPGATLLMAVVLWFAFVFFARMGPTFDGRNFRMFFFMIVVALSGTVAFHLLRLFNVWRALSAMLRKVSSSPLAPAFKRLPHRFWRDLGSRVFAKSFLEEHHEVLDAYRDRLSNQWTNGPVIAFVSDNQLLDTKDESEIRNRRQEWPNIKSWNSRRDDDILFILLDRYWKRRPLPDEVIPPPAHAGSDGASVDIKTAIDHAGHAWFRMVEEYLAVRFTHLIDRSIAQVRGIILFCTAATVLLLLALSVYPFEPHQFIMAFLFVIGVAVVTLSLWVFVQINRDQVVSDITGTKGGEVTWNIDFLSQLFLVIVVPILSFLSAQYPEWMAWFANLIGGYRAGK